MGKAQETVTCVSEESAQIKDCVKHIRKYGRKKKKIDKKKTLKNETTGAWLQPMTLRAMNENNDYRLLNLIVIGNPEWRKLLSPKHASYKC